MKKMIAKIGYYEAVRSANQGCPFFFYQPRLPEAVKKLKRN